MLAPQLPRERTVSYHPPRQLEQCRHLIATISDDILNRVQLSIGQQLRCMQRLHARLQGGNLHLLAQGERGR